MHGGGGAGDASAVAAGVRDFCWITAGSERVREAERLGLVGKRKDPQDVLKKEKDRRREDMDDRGEGREGGELFIMVDRILRVIRGEGKERFNESTYRLPFY